MKKPKIKGLDLVTTPVFVGSRGRPDFPLSKLCTGFYLLVEPQEEKLYRARQSRFNKLIVLPKNNGGFSFMMNSILREAKERGFEYFMYIDDDVLGFSSRTKKVVSLDVLFLEGVEIMKKESISQLGICFKGHDFYRVEEGKQIYKNGEFTKNVGGWSFFIGKTSDFLAVGGYDEILPIFCDFEMAARLLMQGHRVIRWNEYHFDHKMKSLAGGAENVYSKLEVLEKGIEILKTMYGEEMLRVVYAHDQPEVRFRWGKLAKKGLAYGLDYPQLICKNKQGKA